MLHKQREIEMLTVRTDRCLQTESTLVWIVPPNDRELVAFNCQEWVSRKGGREREMTARSD